MSWSARAILAVVELTLYIAFIPAVAYTLSKHRLPSLFGHIFFFAFLLLRIVTDGLTISQRNDTSPSTSNLIINSIGLSPLLLAAMGFITEVRSAQITSKSSREAFKISVIVDLLMHILVVGGIVLLAIGSSNAATAKTIDDVNTNRTLADAGAGLLLLSWLAICVWAFLSFRNTTEADANRQQLPRRLMIAILISLCFLGVRVLYSVVYVTDHDAHISPTEISFIGYLFLVVLSQFFCAAVLLIGLITTKDILREKAQHQQSIMGEAEVGMQTRK